MSALTILRQITVHYWNDSWYARSGRRTEMKHNAVNSIYITDVRINICNVLVCKGRDVICLMPKNYQLYLTETHIKHTSLNYLQRIPIFFFF